MDTLTIRQLAEFTKLIEDTWTDQTDVLFRGQSQDFPLLPSIARERLTDDALAIENSMLKEFQLFSVPYLRVQPSTIWEWAALAQHHGLPTRLLDWSENPLAALWFTVQRPASQGRNGVLWIFRPSDEDFATDNDKDTLECKRHMVYAPKHITGRITAQVAFFTVHKAWSEDPNFEPLELSSEFGPKLTKVIIPAERFAHFRFHLDHLGVNHVTVFPDLDGLCAHIRWKRCFMPDEGYSQAAEGSA